MFIDLLVIVDLVEIEITGTHFRIRTEYLLGNMNTEQ
jgi:hypothetical protein